MTEFRAVAGVIHDARSYRDVFFSPDEAAIKKTFRSMARIIHPDVVAPQYVDEANDATSKLTMLHNAAQAALRNGTFGVSPALVFESATMRHTVQKKRTRYFDMTAGYDARSETNSNAVNSIVKVATTPRDNELLAAEADTLTVLGTLPDNQRPFFPTLLDSFAVSNGRQRLRANAITALEGFVNLEEVHERYPSGIHPLDAAWMWRRLLWALGGAHENGVLHGAVVPSHIMIHPTLHGVVLVDWCYSVQKLGDDYPTLKAAVTARRDWYAKRILDRQSPTPAHDIALATQSMLYCIGSQPIPDSMRRYFARLTADAGTASAYDALAQFDTLLERLGAPYYPRTYRPLNW